MSIRDQIASRNSLPCKLVQCPAWDCEVWVRAMTAGERDSYELALAKSRDKKGVFVDPNIRAAAVVRCAVVSPTDYTPIFQPGDEKWLKDRDGNTIGKLYDAIAILSGLADEETELGN